jgi:putative endopeptidase
MPAPLAVHKPMKLSHYIKIPILLLAASVSSMSQIRAQEPAATTTADVHGVDFTKIDKNVDPGTDFYNFASGSKDLKIPDDRVSWGNFDIVEERNLAQLRQIMTSAGTSSNLTEEEQKVADLFAVGMDEAAVEAAGSAPIEEWLAKIDAIKTSSDFAATVGKLSLFSNVVFQFGAEPNIHNTDEQIAGASQGGLSLPEPSYYSDPKMKQIRDQFTEHVRKMFVLAGFSEQEAKAQSQAVLKIETALAAVSRTPSELRDVDKNFNLTTLRQWQKEMSSFALNQFLEAVDSPKFDRVDVSQPEFFRGLEKAIESISLPEWKAYLRWHVIDSAAPFLSSKFVNENFDFDGRILNGVSKLKDRWKRVVAATSGALPDAVGKLYVKEHFSPEAKEKALEMVHNILAAFKERLANIDWMGPETRAKALAKLAALGVKIGYPDDGHWHTYDLLKIERSASYFENIRRASAYGSLVQIQKIGARTDRLEWAMSPQTVNAQYDPSRNDISFPAGILQPPFFDIFADLASIYGFVGVIMGHEATHGDDDQGSLFDRFGNRITWMNKVDKRKFDGRIKLIRNQYSKYALASGLHLKGDLVSGEACADLGGVSLAYEALQMALAKHGHTLIAGYTDNERFFMAFAQAFGSQTRKEAEEVYAKSDPHPPDRFRVNGSLGNFQPFADAFHLPKNAPIMLPPSKRCVLWLKVKP